MLRWPRKQGYGNLMLTLEQQAAFVEEAPEIFLPIPGGWGKMGHTHIRLAAASEDVLTGALRTAWKLRIDKNAKTSRKNPMWCFWQLDSAPPWPSDLAPPTS